MTKDDLSKILDLTPRAVVEMRRKSKSAVDGFIYNAEVIFDGTNYIIGKNYPTREQAKEVADQYVTDLIRVFRSHANKFLENFPKAKE